VKPDAERVSPVISGLVFVLLFGAQGYWGPYGTAMRLLDFDALAGFLLIGRGERPFLVVKRRQTFAP
jgi:hypothetical protein